MKAFVLTPLVIIFAISSVPGCGSRALLVGKENEAGVEAATTPAGDDAAGAGNGGMVSTGDGEPSSESAAPPPSPGVGVVTLVDGLKNPSYLVVDDANVYFTTWSDSSMGDVVMKVPIAGGAASVLAVGQGLAGGLAFYGGNLYWTNSVGGGGGSVATVPTHGGAATILATGQTYPMGPAVNATGIYWSNDVENGGTVMRQPLDGRAPVVFASGQSWPNAIAVDATGVSWVAIDGIWHASLDGAAPRLISQGGTNNGTIATDGMAVYSRNGILCGVTRFPLDGSPGQPVSMLACLPAVPDPPESSIAVDSTAVYWANAVVIDPVAPGSPLRSGTIVRAPVPGSAASSVTVLASGQNAPNNVATDATRVYWTNHGMNGLPGQVMMAPK